MNPPVPRRFFYLLLLFVLLVCVLFAAATSFFPARSIERISAYFILTMGTCVLMCAVGLALTHRWIEQHFATAKSTADVALPEADPIDSTETETKAVLGPPPQTDRNHADKPDIPGVASATN